MKGQVIIHRKVDSQAKCICGSKMRYSNRAGWLCKRQEKKDEPNRLEVEE